MTRNKPRAKDRRDRKRGVERDQPELLEVLSLLAEMRDGNEYQSIVELRPRDGNLVPELRRAIADLEEIRGRRCLCYVSNVIKELPDTSIHPSDHLPFNEMVEQVPPDIDAVDIFLVTPGGSAEQVTLFVDALRPRFNSVEFILPYKAMSAGSLWALSGEKIWMDRRAFIGPIDPQIRSSEGRLVPAQALLTLLGEIQKAGAEALQNNQDVPWAYVRLLDRMDQHQLGHAINSTQYVIKIASNYLENYKFRNWSTHASTGQPVSDQEREQRALRVAAKICDHKQWKAHGHAINRDAVYKELNVKIDRLEDLMGFERAVRRLWALFYYVFDKSNCVKMMVSQEYSVIRNAVVLVPSPPQSGGQ